MRTSASRPVWSPEGLSCCSELRYSKNKTASPAGTARKPNVCVSHCHRTKGTARVNPTRLPPSNSVLPRATDLSPRGTAR